METAKKLDFEKTKVSTLFRKIFIPTLLGMVSVSAVTTIDGIFVGHGIGSDGIAAINLCIPLLMVLTGIGLMAGMGSSVIASINLSQGKIRLARATVTHALLSGTIVTMSVVGFILAFPEESGRLLGASEHLLPMVLDYLLWFSPSLVMELLIAVSMFAMRLDGVPKLAMWCSIIAAVTNVFLDWLFIFPLGWGIMGAALATTISCICGGAVAVGYLMFYAEKTRLHNLRFSRRGMMFLCRDITEQCKIGSSALLGEATMAVLMFVGNHVFMRYLGDSGVAAFGVSCYYLPFVFMIGNAIAQSAQPIISYNFGAGNKERTRESLRISLETAVTYGLLATGIFVFIPKLLVGMFIPLDTDAAKIAVEGFPYFGVAFTFFIFNLSAIGYFQSVERIKPATIFSMLRGCVFLIPSFIVLPEFAGINGIWMSLALSEFLTSVAICAFYLVNHKQRRVTANV